MFDTSLILVGAQFIVKGGVQPLGHTFMQGNCLYSNYGSALRPWFTGSEFPFKPQADPVGPCQLTYEAPVPFTFTLQAYRMARWSSYLKQPRLSPSLITCLL